MLPKIVQELEDSIAVKKALIEGPLIQKIEAVGAQIATVFSQGGKIYICGNGGSAADAQHLAAEFIGRFTMERAALPAVALTTNSSVLTALTNDYSFDEVFARQVEALVQPQDLVFGISTSGNSGNVIKAMQLAKERGAFTVGLAGESGGKMMDLADICLNVPSTNTARIQEAHITVGHIICGLVEEKMFGNKNETMTNPAQKLDLNQLQAIVFDFDGVLTDNKVYVNQNGEEMVCCDRADGLAFDYLRTTPLKTFILSTETNQVVQKRAEKLQIPCYFGSQDKVASLKQLAQEKGFALEKTLFVGNDVNDYQAMQVCGFSACPADSHATILEKATYQLKSKGGQAVVREIVENLLQINL